MVRFGVGCCTGAEGCRGRSLLASARLKPPGTLRSNRFLRCDRANLGPETLLHATITSLVALPMRGILVVDKRGSSASGAHRKVDGHVASRRNLRVGSPCRDGVELYWPGGHAGRS